MLPLPQNKKTPKSMTTLVSGRACSIRACNFEKLPQWKNWLRSCSLLPRMFFLMLHSVRTDSDTYSAVAGLALFAKLSRSRALIAIPDSHPGCSRTTGGSCWSSPTKMSKSVSLFIMQSLRKIRLEQLQLLVYYMRMRKNVH